MFLRRAQTYIYIYEKDEAVARGFLVDMENNGGPSIQSGWALISPLAQVDMEPQTAKGPIHAVRSTWSGQNSARRNFHCATTGRSHLRWAASSLVCLRLGRSGWSSQRRAIKVKSSGVNLGKCKLLVDDKMSVAQIERAAEMLREEGWDLGIELFAEPGRCKDENWRALLDRSEVTLATSSPGQAKDSLRARALQLAEAPSGCLSMLVCDADLAELVSDLPSQGKKAIVILSAQTSILSRYKATTADVRSLPSFGSVELVPEPALRLAELLIAAWSGQCTFTLEPRK